MEKFDPPPYSEWSSASKIAAFIGGRHLQSKEQFWLVAPAAILEEPFASILSTLKLETPQGRTKTQIGQKSVAETPLSRLGGVPWMEDIDWLGTGVGR